MPYKNILWIKLEKRLLNDYRFYTLSEDSQLIYVKLLMLSAETINKIPKNTEILKNCFRSSLTPEKIENCLKEIQNNFPKFKNKGNFYYFGEWKYKHNWKPQGTPKELPRKSKGTPKETLDKSRVDKIRVDKNIPLSAPADTPHHRIFSFFLEEVKKRYGVAPEFNGKKDGVLVKKRLVKYGEDKTKAIIDYYLESKKCKEFGFNLSVALSADTINHYLKENEAFV